MSRIGAKLCIVLKSDMCVGSGDGFSSGIDLDVCYDGDGLPIIPARRIKGCLKDAAKLVGCSRLHELFGASRSKESGSLVVRTACIADSQRVVCDNPQETPACHDVRKRRYGFC